MRTMSVEACLEGLMQNDRDLMEVVHLHISLSKLQERFIIYFPNSRLEKKKYIYIYILTRSVHRNRVKIPNDVCIWAMVICWYKLITCISSIAVLHVGSTEWQMLPQSVTCLLCTVNICGNYITTILTSTFTYSRNKETNRQCEFRTQINTPNSPLVTLVISQGVY